VSAPALVDPAFFGGRTVLVTGGAGFIGSHLAAHFLAAGADVRVLDDLSTGHRRNVPGGARFHEGSILDGDLLAAAVRGCDCIFHLAAVVSVPQSVEDPEGCMRVNVTGTQRVLDAAVTAGVRRVLCAASAAAYGATPSLPSRESDPVDCWSPYAASKVACEVLLQAYARCFPLSTVSLRFFNIFGPRQDPRSAYAAVISAFADALQHGRTPRIFGDGTQTRDFTFVDNVVFACALAAASSRPLAGEIINVGCGERIELRRVLESMTHAWFGGPHAAAAPNFEPPRAGDVPHSLADITRARELLGYEPIVRFDEGIRRLVEDMR
jgi:UDP-glucose 4-epimerase